MRLSVFLALIALLSASGVAVSAAEYKLGPGDLVAVRILDFDNLGADVRVQPDGDITLPLVGAVTAAGKTAPELAKDLTKKYAEYVVKPSVSVIISEFRQDTCIILGQVSKPGPTPIDDTATVRTALAAAGGALERADLSRVTITRKGANLSADLAAAAADPKADIQVLPGDIIMVPEATIGVLALGSVVKPGGVDWREGMRITDVLSSAGGLLDDADPASAMLGSQDGKQIPVNLADLLQKGATDQNLVVHRGDVLYVPRQDKRYYVFGEVAKPGQYPVKGSDSLLGALSLAGGTAANADLAGIGVVRLVDGKPQVVKANLALLAKTGDQSQNVAIQPSDVVFVPAKKSKFSWSNVTAPLSVAGLVLSLKR